MKKIYKVMVFVLMLALAIGGAVVAPITLLATSSVLIGASIVLTKMPTTGKTNTTIQIPAGTTSTSGSEVTVKVTDPYGKEVATTLNGDKYEFVAKTKGDYKVVYTASAVAGVAAQTTSEVYTIKVTEDDAALSFASNSAFVFQSKVGADSKLVLPYPNVKLANEDEEIAGHYAGEGTTNANISVTVTDPAHNVWAETTSVQDYTSPLATVTIDGAKYYTFAPAKVADGEAQKTLYGTYVIAYKYVNAETNAVKYAQKTIQVSEGYSVENQKITFTWDGSLPESAVLGNELTLPKPVTVDENRGGASVQTYTAIEVKYHNGEEVQKVDVNDFKFTPMYEAKNGSYYELTYKIYTLEQLNLASYTKLEDALAAAADKALVKTYTLSNVTDTEAPKPKAVNAYQIEDNKTLAEEVIELLEDEDVSYAIPSKSKTQVEVVIPAIYATDNYSKYQDLTLTRTLIDENGVTYSLDGEETLNETDDLKAKIVQAKQNANATVMFRAKGTYTVRYRATDKANNTAEVSYKIVVSDTLEDDLAPYIVLPTIDSTAKPTEKLTFAAATIVDYKDDHSEGATTTTTIDTNVKKDVYYFYGKADSTTDFAEMLENGELTRVAKDATDTTKYSLVIDENPTSNYLTIVFRAEDDGKYATGRTENNVGWKYKVVAIYSASDDAAPTMETDLTNMMLSLNGTHGQNEVVNLNSAIDFTDGEETQNLVASLSVLDNNGNKVNVSGLKYVYDGSKYSIQGGKIITTVAGVYQVVVTATDLAGNSLINSFQFEVKDTKAPVIEVDAIETTMELGKTYKLPAPVVKDDNVIIENKAASQVEFGDDCPLYEFNQGTLEFKPKEEGTYTFRYVAEDDAGNTAASSYYTITVTATVAPEITIDETSAYYIADEKTYEYKNASGEVVNVSLPLFTATSEYNGIKSLTVTVTDPDGDELTVENKDDHYEFTPNKNGVFTVTYKAVDNANKSSTKVYAIKVGDVTAPTLSGVVAPVSYNIGDTMSIQLANLSVKDDIDGTTIGTSAVNNDRLAITLTGPDGNEVTLTKGSDVYSYEFTTSGNYTLKYTVKDAAGNTDDVVYTFEVKAQSNSKSVSEIAWGTALIVASVALIAGVVVYFIRTKDPTEKAEKEEKKKED